MPKTLTSLLAGAALTLCAGAALAAADPRDAVREAEADARAAFTEGRAAMEEGRAAALEARERAREAGERAREAGERARDTGRAAAREARRAVHVYRSGGGDAVYFDGGSDRSDYLSDILQLRPDQAPALKAFLDATRNEGRHRDHVVTFDRDAEERTTLQRLDEMQAKMAEQQAEATRRIAAIRTFYGQLDAGQKKAFDAMPMLMMAGPSVGPMMIPHRIPIAHRMPIPPTPPVPPVPPAPPRS